MAGAVCDIALALISTDEAVEGFIALVVLKVEEGLC
jgi:hypothetical protein